MILGLIMRHHIHAEHLMSDDRRASQDPVEILNTIGVKKGIVVADLGCGPGFFTIPLASIVGPGGVVYAVDSDSDMLKHLRQNIEKSGLNEGVIRIVRADVSETGIPSHSVDLVLFVRLLHDIENKKLFLDEVRRICRPGAKIVDLDWKKIETDHGPPLRIRLSEDESRQILSVGGFEVLEQIEAGKDHYGLICEVASV